MMLVSCIPLCMWVVIPLYDLQLCWAEPVSTEFWSRLHKVSKVGEFTGSVLCATWYPTMKPGQAVKGRREQGRWSGLVTGDSLLVA